MADCTQNRKTVDESANKQRKVVESKAYKVGKTFATVFLLGVLLILIVYAICTAIRPVYPSYNDPMHMRPIANLGKFTLELVLVFALMVGVGYLMWWTRIENVKEQQTIFNELCPTSRSTLKFEFISAAAIKFVIAVILMQFSGITNEMYPAVSTEAAAADAATDKPSMMARFRNKVQEIRNWVSDLGDSFRTLFDFALAMVYRPLFPTDGKEVQAQAETTPGPVQTPLSMGGSGLTNDAMWSQALKEAAGRSGPDRLWIMIVYGIMQFIPLRALSGFGLTTVLSYASILMLRMVDHREDLLKFEAVLILVRQKLAHMVHSVELVGGILLGLAMIIGGLAIRDTTMFQQYKQNKKETEGVLYFLGETAAMGGAFGAFFALQHGLRTKGDRWMDVIKTFLIWFFLGALSHVAFQFCGLYTYMYTIVPAKPKEEAPQDPKDAGGCQSTKNNCASRVQVVQKIIYGKAPV